MVSHETLLDAFQVHELPVAMVTEPDIPEGVESGGATVTRYTQPEAWVTV